MTKSELEILFKAHYAAMFRLAVSLLYDADEARDVVSDVFASLLDGVVREEHVLVNVRQGAFRDDPGTLAGRHGDKDKDGMKDSLH